jgi:hypothetical protein
MENIAPFRLFNVDEIFQSCSADEKSAATIDLCVAALAFRNFDFYPRRFPFIVECVCSSEALWQMLFDQASACYWLRDRQEGILVYEATSHCGCLRTYRFKSPHFALRGSTDRSWKSIATEADLYQMLDTPSAREIYRRWYDWTETKTQQQTALAQGRMNNTSVNKTIIFSGEVGCVACNAPATGYANTTLGIPPDASTLVQLPVCQHHLRLASEAPNVLTFLLGIFNLSMDLPVTRSWDAIPDEMIADIHQHVADELEGVPGQCEKRKRGWLLEIRLSEGWRWLLRLNTLMDYSYMLFRPDDKKAVYRADSAPDHPDLAFFPHHEHSRPDRKSDVRTTSFLYGLPLFDIVRLKTLSQEKRRQAK